MCSSDLVGLFIVVFGLIGLIKLIFTTWVFPQADSYNYEMRPMVLPREKINSESSLVKGLENCKESCDLSPNDKESLSEWLAEYQEYKKNTPQKQISANRQRQLSQNLAMILVGLPLYLYHWATIKKGAKKKTNI